MKISLSTDVNKRTVSFNRHHSNVFQLCVPMFKFHKMEVVHRNLQASTSFMGQLLFSSILPTCIFTFGELNVERTTYLSCSDIITTSICFPHCTGKCLDIISCCHLEKRREISIVVCIGFLKFIGRVKSQTRARVVCIFCSLLVISIC